MPIGEGEIGEGREPLWPRGLVPVMLPEPAMLTQLPNTPGSCNTEKFIIVKV